MSDPAPNVTPAVDPAPAAVINRPVPPQLLEYDRKHRTMIAAMKAEVGILFMVLAGIGALLVGAELGIGILTGDVVLGLFGLVLGFVPLPVVFAFALWLDRYEPEPVWLLVRTILWGALVATSVAVFFNTAIGAIFGEFVALAFGAPLVEESLKALAVIYVYRKRREHLHGVIDGIVYGIMVGLGFTVIEDISYYLMSGSEEGAGGVFGTFLVRTFMGAFSHSFFTSMTGIGIGLAMSRTGFKKWACLLGGWWVAMFLHGLWNGSSAISPFATFGLFFLFYVPAFVVWIVVGGKLRAQQYEKMGRILPDEVERSVITEEDMNRLARPAYGRGMFLSAMGRRHGAWQAWRVFLRSCLHLVEHRDQMSVKAARGLPADPADTDIENELRRRVGKAREDLMQSGGYEAMGWELAAA